VKDDAPFTDDQARAAWNEGARAFEIFVESGADYYRREVHGPALLDACGPVADQRVLDLGCGQGFFTRQLARAGARATGVDLANELIVFALEHEKREPLGIEYRAMSATGSDRHWPAATFDVVTACMAIQDMADVEGTLRSAHVVLKRDGRLVFSVPHPCTDTPVREWERDGNSRKLALKIDRYFDAGAAVCHWNMPRLTYVWDTPCWRYTLTDWSRMIAGTGFLIRRMHEPRPTDEQVRRQPKLEDCWRLPYFLIFDLTKER
jgi:2-polyprenyl-3-methyl-5-hydroxy-6-metoxy-1,4-benzoquinol methylase